MKRFDKRIKWTAIMGVEKSVKPIFWCGSEGSSRVRKKNDQLHFYCLGSLSCNLISNLRHDANQTILNIFLWDWKINSTKLCFPKGWFASVHSLEDAGSRKGSRFSFLQFIDFALHFDEFSGCVFGNNSSVEVKQLFLIEFWDFAASFQLDLTI